ncbi:hypothetical protein ACMFMG_011631 [Clarireedia jacksonii]
MPLRPLRPSNRQGDGNLAAGSSNQLATPEANADERAQKNNICIAAPGAKRRRKPEHVVQNACTNCRGARAKCDGKEPCGRCVFKALGNCAYQPHTKHAKMQMVESLRSYQHWRRDAESIFHAIEANENISIIIDRLQNHGSIESIAQWLQSTNDDLDGRSSGASPHSTIEPTDNETNGVGPSAFQWSSLPADEEIMHHLFTLYFTWVHPVHTLFDEGIFVNHYRNGPNESNVFCSIALVNAICAMACYHHTPVDGDTTDFDLLGKDFSDAASHMLDHKDYSLVNVQAFAIMFLVACARGKGLLASEYLTMANNLMANLKCFEGEWYERVWRNTARGLHCLNIEWAQMTFRTPPVFNTTFSNYLTVDEVYDQQLDEREWAFYRFPRDNNDQNISWQSSFMATNNREKAKFAAIVGDIEILLYDVNGPPISAEHILNLYGRLKAWRNELPSIIANSSNKHTQLLPHTISLLTMYHTAIVHLLRPFLDFDGFPTSLVDHILWEHAQQGLSLLEEHYHSLDISRYQPVMQMFAILHLTDVRMRFYTQGWPALKLAISILAQSHSGYPVTETFLQLLYKTAKDLMNPLPNDLEEDFHNALPNNSRFLLADVLDAFTRPTYTQPVHVIQKRFSPTISAEWVALSPSFGFQSFAADPVSLRQPSEEERGAQHLMQIRNFLNIN